MNMRTAYHRTPSPPLVETETRPITPELLRNDEIRADFMQQVRDALYMHGNLEWVARIIGCHPRTLYAIRGGYTRWPRWTTLFPLVEALGFEVVIVPKERPALNRRVQ